MPDFAPNATGRYRVHYVAAGRSHTIQMRTARGLTFTQIESNGSAFIEGLFSALATALTDDLAFTSAEVALHDEDLFFPAAVPAAVTGTFPVADMSKQDSITHLTFSGRGSGGSKVNMKVYGVATNPDALPAGIWSDFVMLGSELANIANAVTHLNDSPSLSVAIDNTIPTYVNRATIKVNDYWLRRVRQGL